MIQSLYFSLLFTLCSLWPLHSKGQIKFTAAELQFIERHETITLGGDPAWEPIIIEKEDGSIGGFERQLLDEIEKVIPLKFELKATNWQELVAQAESKKIDGLVYSSIQPQRKAHFHFTNSYNRFKVGFYGPIGSEPLSELADLSGLSVGVQSSDLFANNYLDSLSNVKKVVFKSRSELVQALLSQKIDLLLSAMDFNYYLWKNSISGIQLAYLPEDDGFDLVYSIRKDWPELVSILNKALHEIGEERIISLMNIYLQPNNNSQAAKDHQLMGSYRQLNLVTIEKWLPVVAVNERGDLGGWLGDYMQLFQEVSSTSLQVIGTGDSSMIDSMAALPNTVFVYPDFEKKKPEFHYSNPILSIPYGIATLKGAFFSDINNMGDIQVAVMSYNPHIEQIETMYPHMRLVQMSNTRDAMDLVLSGRLDGYIGSISTLNYHIQSLGYSELYIAGLVDIHTTLHFSSANQGLIDSMNDVMTIIPEGKKQALIKNWYGGHPNMKGRELAYRVGLIAFGVLLIIGIWAFSLLRQIRKRKRIYQQLQKNQANIYALIENTDALIYSIDQNLRIIATNSAFVRFLGFFSNLPVAKGTALPEVIPDKFKETWILRYTRALNGGKFTEEDTLELMGQTRTYISHLNPIRVDNKIVGVSCLSEDVTKFTKLNQYMISLMESSFDYIFIKDLEGKYVVASQSLAELNGKSSWKEMIDKTDQEILPDYYQLFEKEDNRVLSSGVHIINNVQQFLDNNGQKRWIETTKEPIYGRSGKIIGLSGISRDISEQKKAEEEQLMLIATIENSQDLIYFLDNDLNIIYMNPYGKQVIGLKEGARINLSQLLESVTYKVVKNALEKIVAKQGVWHEEFDINKINTSESITMDHNIIAIYNEADEFVCFASVSRDVTERNKLQQEVMDAKIQGELINASLKAEDNERIRIAHELHDGIQQQIATVSIYLQSIDLKNEPEEVIEQSLAKLNETIGEIRRMSNRLLPRALMNVGLQGVIQDEVQTITKGSSLTLSFYENLGEDRIDSEVELNLYRIFQEAISNILKYSRAKEVEIQLLLNNNLLTLSIEDDGVGFYVKEREHAGIGLSSMKNRAESIGAHFELDSTPGVGTSLLIEVKL